MLVHLLCFVAVLLAKATVGAGAAVDVAVSSRTGNASLLATSGLAAELLAVLGPELLPPDGTRCGARHPSERASPECLTWEGAASIPSCP